MAWKHKVTYDHSNAINIIHDYQLPTNFQKALSYPPAGMTNI